MLQRYPRAGGVNPTVRLGVVELATGQTVWMRGPDGPAAELGLPEGYIGRVSWDGAANALLFQLLSREQKRLALMRARSCVRACSS